MLWQQRLALDAVAVAPVCVATRGTMVPYQRRGGTPGCRACGDGSAARVEKG